MCVKFGNMNVFFVLIIIISCSKHVMSQFGRFNMSLSTSFCLPYDNPSEQFSLTAPFESCKATAQRGLLLRHPDQDKTTPQIMETYGYPYETHRVTTEDNYILTVFRIIGSPNISRDRWASKKFPVYLQHGIAMASDGWNFQPGTRNLPFKLADAGYEIWIGNARGTSYSLGHTTYNADRNLQFWNFSFDEMGRYDVTAVTKKILIESGAEKLLYIGHSMGTTQLIVSLSEIPEMNDYIEAAFLMAPAIYVGHSSHLGARILAPLSQSSIQGWQ